MFVWRCAHVSPCVNIFLTGVHVRAKSECAVLHVERKAEYLQVAGRDEPQHSVPADAARVVDVDIRARLGNIVIHTGRVGDEGIRMKTKK